MENDNEKIITMIVIAGTVLCFFIINAWILSEVHKIADYFINYVGLG